jgi:hypothetical protein
MESHITGLISTALHPIFRIFVMMVCDDGLLDQSML